MSSNFTKIVFVFLVVVCFLLMGAFYIRTAIVHKMKELGARLSMDSGVNEWTFMMLDLNKADNHYQEAIVKGDSVKYAGYVQSMNLLFQRLDSVIVKYSIDTSWQFVNHEPLLRQAIASKIGFSSKVFRMKKDFDSLLFFTDKNFKTAKTNPRPVKRIMAEVGTITTADTLKETRVNPAKSKSLLKRLKEAILNNKEKDTVGSTVLIKQRESLLKTRATPEEGIAFVPDEKNLLAKLKMSHRKLSNYQLELVFYNMQLLSGLRELITNLGQFHYDLWQFQQREFLKQHAETSTLLDRFNLFIMLLLVLFLLLLFFYLRKIYKTEMSYQQENLRAVTLAEERSEMLARMSHEIRNPLMAITGFIDILKEEKLEARHRKMVESVHIASEMLLNTVNDILDITKFQFDASNMIHFKQFKPWNEVSNVVDTMRFVAAKKNLQININCLIEEDLMVKGDPFRLKQVLLNLLTNAIKFTDEGGIYVELSLEKEPNQDRPRLKIAVKDTGIGIKKELQNKLFSKYVQGDGSREKGGSGLGLYICKQLLQIQGGTIEVFSEGERKGSTFTVSIPYTVVVNEHTHL